MNIILFHNHFDAKHLENVTAQMQKLGAPTIKAVWMECFSAWVALEGCHRIRAAYSLGLTPEIDEIEYSETETLNSIGVEHECDEDYTIASICDDAYANDMIEFED